jgi:leucyl aminopeptidase (aminopeptidase T)
MRETNYEQLAIFLTVSSIIFLLLSFLFLVIGIVFNNYFIEVFKFMITVTIAFISLYFGIRSVILSKQANTLGEESKKIANDSDEKMKAIASYHLLEVKGIIEDIRLTLQKHIKKLELMAKTNRDYTIAYDVYHTDYSYSMWKCYKNLQRAQTLLDYSNSDYQKEVIDYVHKYFDVVKEGRDKTQITLIEEHKKHIRMSYDIISKFPAFHQYTQRNELLKIVEDITS